MPQEYPLYDQASKFLQHQTSAVDFVSTFKSLDPAFSYQFTLDRVPADRIGNWNVVALSGEYLRFKSGFSPDNSFVQRLPGWRPTAFGTN